MAILRTQDDFIWLDVTERCTNDEKTTTEIWLGHELYAVSVRNNDDVLLETYEEVVLAIENECLICIKVGQLPERPLKLTGEMIEVQMTEPEVDLTSFSWDDFTNLK